MLANTYPPQTNGISQDEIHLETSLWNDNEWIQMSADENNEDEAR